MDTKRLLKPVLNWTLDFGKYIVFYLLKEILLKLVL